MLTVHVSLPPVASPGSVAEAVLSAAFLLIGRATLEDGFNFEANILLSVAARNIRAGRSSFNLKAPNIALALAANACRRRAAELYDGCPATPVLLTLALGCEAAATREAA